MRRYVVGSLIGTASVLAIAILGYLPRTSRDSQRLSKAHNFGVVPPGTALQHTFKYLNTSTTACNIVEIRTTCGCTRASAVPLEVPPGEFAEIFVDYKTPTVEGPNLQQVRVRLDGSKSASTEVFELGCLVREKMRVSPKAAVLVKREHEWNVWAGSLSVSNSTNKDWGGITVATGQDWLKCESIVSVKPEAGSHEREGWRVQLVGVLKDAEAMQPMNDVITIRASTADGGIEQRVAVTIPGQPALRSFPSLIVFPRMRRSSEETVAIQVTASDTVSPESLVAATCSIDCPLEMSHAWVVGGDNTVTLQVKARCGSNASLGPFRGSVVFSNPAWPFKKWSLPVHGFVQSEAQ